MRRDPLCFDNNLGFAFMPGDNNVGGRLADNRIIRPDMALIEQMPEPFPVTIFFENCTGDINCLSGCQSPVFCDTRNIYLMGSLRELNDEIAI